MATIAIDILVSGIARQQINSSEILAWMTPSEAQGITDLTVQ